MKTLGIPCAIGSVSASSLRFFKKSICTNTFVDYLKWLSFSFNGSCISDEGTSEFGLFDTNLTSMVKVSLFYC
jgi:hypothetical protein